MTRLEAAKDYMARGWTPIPIPPRSKNPGFKRWQKYKPAGRVERDFGGDGNAGLLLGAPSDGLTDVDLDWREAAALAPKFLPATSMKSGRKSAPRSHWWYLAEGLATKKYFDPNGAEGDDRAMIVELRGTGGQTVVAPSIHPSGEAYEWDGDLTPPKTDPATLSRAVARVAACALVARYWREGKRHDSTLALSGALFRNGWTRAEVEGFVLSAANVAADDEINDRRQAIADTERALQTGENTTGLPVLSTLLGKATVDALIKWLDLRAVNDTEPLYFDSGPPPKMPEWMNEMFADSAPAAPQSAPSADSQTVPVDDWPEPQPIPDGLLPVPQLPVALIPAAFRGWIYDIADRLQVPLEFPAVPAIVAAGSVIGNQIRIRPKAHDDWAVTPNEWGAVVGRPGVMKSPAIAEALKPLRRICADAEKKFKEALKAWKFQKEAQKARLEATRKKMKTAAGKGENLDRFKDDLASDDQDEPTERRYVVNDSTVEKFGALLNENPNGLLLFRDELTGWFRALDDDRRANDRAFFLECWNGDNSYTYDRIERGTLKIENATASVLGGIQPGPLQSYLRGALGCGEGDDGLLQRFQMAVFPDLPVDFKYIDRWPDTEAKNTAYVVFERISNIPVIRGAAQDDDGKLYLRFSPEAQELFVEWYSDLRREILSGAFDHPAIEAHAAKYAKLMPALALIFEVVNGASGGRAFDGFVGSVSKDSAEIAAAWCDFLLSHAKRIYGLGLASASTYARAIAFRLQAGDLTDKDEKGKLKGFTARDIYYRGWSGLTTAESVKEPLDLLEHLGWIRGGLVSDGGRPATRYKINPRSSEASL